MLSIYETWNDFMVIHSSPICNYRPIPVFAPLSYISDRSSYFEVYRFCFTLFFGFKNHLSCLLFCVLVRLFVHFIQQVLSFPWWCSINGHCLCLPCFGLLHLFLSTFIILSSSKYCVFIIYICFSMFSKFPTYFISLCFSVFFLSQSFECSIK